MDEPRLVLGPLLRHVDATSATVWVETDRRCVVEILEAQAHTFCVGGHHYALVMLDGLRPGSSNPYQVRLDGRTAWPPAAAAFPESTIRTHATNQGSALRIAFGSCRFAAPLTDRQRRKVGGDALNAYAERMAEKPESQWADALLLLGDQVYADETSPRTQQWLRRRRDTTQPPKLGIADFEEYTHLYQETWSDPQIRWLMSTVPTSMIFDDHDVLDDWNTSRDWRQEMARLPWWTARMRGALVSYWVYQHIGNLAPADLLDDPLFEEVQRVGAQGDAHGVLREFADRADAEADGEKPTRWSYRRDFGSVRLLVIDTRCGRILDGQRLMVSDAEFDWILNATRGDYEHLVVGSSVPWLLPHVVHDLESANELACEREGWRGRLGERVRQALDLEHWAAFRLSFDRLSNLLGDVARGRHTPQAPVTITVLSGDVHHSYIAEARFAQPATARVWQLTCSPVHNAIPRLVELAFRAAWEPRIARVTSWWARRRGIPPLPVTWTKLSGPVFRNQIASLEITDDRASVVFESDEQAGAPVTIPLSASTGSY
ncbi:MAG: alkaline phosphatase D family protein [Haloechinothrix sp.]